MNDVTLVDVEDIPRMVRALAVGQVRDLDLWTQPPNGLARQRLVSSRTRRNRVWQAAWMHSLAKNQALVDSKRIAWLATVVFCDLNAVAPSLTDD